MKKERKTKRFIYYAAGGCMFLLLCLFLSNCQDDLEFGFLTEGTLDVQTREMASTAELAKARAYYEQARKGTELLTRSLELEDTISKYSPYTPTLNGDPSWLYYACNQNDTLLAVDVDVTDRIMQDYILQESWEGYQKYKQLKYRRSYTRYVYIRHLKTGEEQGFFMTIVPSLNCTRNYSTRIERNTYLYRDKYLSGYVLFHNMDGTFANGWEYKDGQIVGRVFSPRAAKRLGLDMSKRLCLGKLPASYQVDLKLDEQPRVQTRSSGESEGGGDGTVWLPEVVVTPGGDGGGSDDGWDDDFGDWGDPFGDGDNTGDNTGDDGDPVIDSGDGDSGGSSGGSSLGDGGYNPPPSDVYIDNPSLQAIYDYWRSNLTQTQVNKLLVAFDMFESGDVGNVCMFILECNMVSMMFEVNFVETGNNTARFNWAENKISFRDDVALTQLAPLTEEMCHAMQYYGYYGFLMDNTVANYEFEAKVLTDINTYSTGVTAGYVGIYEIDNASEEIFRNYAILYNNFIEKVASSSEWTEEMQTEFNELGKIWNDYNKKYRPNTSYGRQHFEKEFIPEALKDYYNYKQ